MALRHSRPEAFAKIQTTLVDIDGKQASIIDEATYNDPKGDLKFKGLEAGTGIKIFIRDADESRFSTPEKKIVIEASGGGGSNVDLLVYEAPITHSGQTVFSLPFDTVEINTITVNGLESTSWLFTLGPPVLTFNPSLEGYQLDPDDELLVFYKKSTTP